MEFTIQGLTDAAQPLANEDGQQVTEQQIRNLETVLAKREAELAKALEGPPMLTRRLRELKQFLRNCAWVAPWVKAAITATSTSILISDRLSRKPKDIAVTVHEKSHTTDALLWRADGHASVAWEGTVTAAPAPEVPCQFPSIPVHAPVEFRRALWDMRTRPKKVNRVAAGRLRWNQRRFPKAPEMWLT